MRLPDLKGKKSKKNQSSLLGGLYSISQGA